MVWSQVYDPFNSMWLSTLVAAIPIVVMLGCLAFLHIKAHWAAILGLISRTDRRDLRLRHAGEDGGAAAFNGAPVRAPADRLDRPQHHLPLPADRRERLVQDTAGLDRPHHAGSPPAAAADRVQLRRVLRGRRGIRHAGGRYRGDPDRPRLLAARRLRPLADRQHRAGGLRRARLADHRACRGDRPRSAGPLGDGRAAAAVLLPARAVLADLGVCWLEGDEGDLAGDPGRWGELRDPAVPDVELTTAHGWWTWWPPWSRWLAWCCSCASGVRRRSGRRRRSRDEERREVELPLRSPQLAGTRATRPTCDARTTGGRSSSRGSRG